MIKSQRPKQFLLFISFFSFLDSSTAQKSNYIGVFVAPSLTKLTRHYDHIKNPFAVAYGFGLTGNFNLCEHMFLRAGIGYQLKREVIGNMTYIPNDFGPDPNEHDGSKYKFTANITYITVPINISYRLSKDQKRKINYFISGGMELNASFKSKTVHHFSYGNKIEKHESDKFNLIRGISVGSGACFNLSENFMILIEPKYCYDVFEMEDSHLFQSIFLNIELNIQCSRK